MGLVAVISLMPLLTACVTTTKTVYVLPEVVWPEFPAPSDSDVGYDNESDMVLMSLEYYEKLKNFKIDYKATKKTYERTKKLYEESK